jgi:hypothetical protein
MSRRPRRVRPLRELGADRRASAQGEPVAGRPRLGVRWSEWLWLTILTAIGVVQIIRAQWFDAVVFFVVVVALLVDAFGLIPAVSRGRRLATRGLVVGAAAIGAVMCFLPRHATWMGVAVLLAGAAGVVIAWPQRPGTAPAWSPGLRRLAWTWSAIVVIGCVWELTQFVLARIAPQRQWFALSDLVDPLVATVPGRILFIAAWVACGAFLLGRGRRA